jgi:hypothetical protein
MSKINTEINENIIKEFLNEIILVPRKSILKWSAITKQTPSIKIGYPAQHLVSLITGIEGTRSGARGSDVSDKSEIKACNRVDQVDTCSDCKGKVLRLENNCNHCGSETIERKNDSKWLFTIRSKEELIKLINIDRIILTIFDYLKFDSKEFDDIRIRVFEIYPKKERHSRFKDIMEEYFYNIYEKNRIKNPKKVPAPKNFWPDSYQFYLCNPIKIFECHISSFNDKPKIEDVIYINPDMCRDMIKSESLPKKLLTKKELQLFDCELNDFLDETQKKLLHIR